MAELPQALLNGACRAADEGALHWSRLQESSVQWQDTSGRVLFVGDAAHAMLPTLGQGATAAMEDGAVFVQMFREAFAAGQSVPTLLQRFEARRRDRVDFIRSFSRQASDVITAERFTLDAVRAKGGAAYRGQFRRLYTVA